MKQKTISLILFPAFVAFIAAASVFASGTGEEGSALPLSSSSREELRELVTAPTSYDSQGDSLDAYDNEFASELEGVNRRPGFSEPTYAPQPALDRPEGARIRAQIASQLPGYPQIPAATNNAEGPISDVSDTGPSQFDSIQAQPGESDEAFSGTSGSGAFYR
jgi:hypothetical protein